MRPKKKKKGRGPATPQAREMKRKPSFSKRLVVIQEDDAIISIDKPAGLPAVPIKGSETSSVLSLLNGQLRAKRQRAFVVHRIDRFTSGIILFAKTEDDRENLIKQFLSHKPVREYLAVVRGKLELESGTLVHYFKRDEQRQVLSTPDDRSAAKAKLSYTVEQNLHGATLVRVLLDTGLQNQIRAQFLAEGHPLIGDRKYSAGEAAKGPIDRVALHATSLTFQHPRSGKKVSVTSEMPHDLRQLLWKLGKARG